MQTPLCNTYSIHRKSVLRPGVVELWVRCPDLAALAVPGQFVMLRCGESFLRRPISICEIDPVNGRIRLVMEVRGGGTAWLAGRSPEEEIDMMGPLGNGFTGISPESRVVLVGGGIGTPPLLGLAKTLLKPAAFLGFRTADAIILAADFAAACGGVTLCTDDGTMGFHGLVTAPLSAYLQKHAVDVICACGPGPMLAAVAKLGREKGIRTLLSLEERMACGVGACLGCAVRLLDDDGQEMMARACKDGPVFDASRVIL